MEWGEVSVYVKSKFLESLIWLYERLICEQRATDVDLVRREFGSVSQAVPRLSACQPRRALVLTLTIPLSILHPTTFRLGARGSLD
jgi:hypothetical protein